MAFNPDEFLAKPEASAFNPDEFLAKTEPKKYTIGESLLTAGKNIIPSTYNVAKGAVQTIAHPANTLEGLIQLTSGGISKALPESIMKYARGIFQDLATD